ncbi:MAG: helix-turn-helix domain-containing protein [Bacteroidales bacterium]|jgi:transcriptional regulator with XRE-family HTH domain|nr:helix-turn-helix domain-containing protein [Bacteroidales bacterium]
MKDRIAKIIREEGYTATKFADEIGVQASSISHILSGRNNPSLDFIIKIVERFRGINPEWLLTGKGYMYKSPVKESDFDENTTFEQPQLDLFTNNPKNQGTVMYESKIPPTVVEDTNNGSGKIESNKSGDIYTEQATQQIINKNIKNVDKIVVFYTDKSFDYYLPNQ